MQKWEYLHAVFGVGVVEKINGKKPESKFDGKCDTASFLRMVGDEGWELVAMTDRGMVFKRPIP
jgi:hypothetical protein